MRPLSSPGPICYSTRRRRVVEAAGDGRPLGDNWRVDQLVYFALTASERVATKSLHYHGGYGFTLEQDVQLYLRYIKAWSLLLGGARSALVRAAGGRGWTTG